MDYKKTKNGDLRYCFTWHECECGLPLIVCRTSHLLKHKYISPEIKEFFDWAEDYVWYDVLPKEGKVKYPRIDFSRKVPVFVCPDKYDNLDLQPPEEVITMSGGGDPHE